LNASLSCREFLHSSHYETLWEDFYRKTYNGVERRQGDPWERLYISRANSRTREKYSAEPNDVLEMFLEMESALLIAKDSRFEEKTDEETICAVSSPVFKENSVVKSPDESASAANDEPSSKQDEKHDCVEKKMCI